MNKIFFKFLPKIKKDQEIRNDIFFLKLQIAFISLLILDYEIFICFFPIIFNFQKNKLIDTNDTNIISFYLLNSNTIETKICLLILFFFIRKISNKNKKHLLKKINKLERIDLKMGFQFKNVSFQDIRLIENYTYYINRYTTKLDLTLINNQIYNCTSLKSRTYLNPKSPLNLSDLRKYSLKCLKDLIKL